MLLTARSIIYIIKLSMYNYVFTIYYATVAKLYTKAANTYIANLKFEWRSNESKIHVHTSPAFASANQQLLKTYAIMLKANSYIVIAITVCTVYVVVIPANLATHL